jgi:hypothetical protein
LLQHRNSAGTRQQQLLHEMKFKWQGSKHDTYLMTIS